MKIYAYVIIVVVLINGLSIAYNLRLRYVEEFNKARDECLAVSGDFRKIGDTWLCFQKEVILT